MTKELQITNNWIALHVSVSDRIDTAAPLDHAMILTKVLQIGRQDNYRGQHREYKSNAKNIALLMVQSQNEMRTRHMKRSPAEYLEFNAISLTTECTLARRYNHRFIHALRAERNKTQCALLCFHFLWLLTILDSLYHNTQKAIRHCIIVIGIQLKCLIVVIICVNVMNGECSRISLIGLILICISRLQPKRSQIDSQTALSIGRAR